MTRKQIVLLALFLLNTAVLGLLTAGVFPTGSIYLKLLPVFSLVLVQALHILNSTDPQTALDTLLNSADPIVLEAAAARLRVLRTTRTKQWAPLADLDTLPSPLQGDGNDGSQ